MAKDNIEDLKKELAQLRKQFGETAKYNLVSKDDVSQIKELNLQILNYKNALDEINDTWGSVDGILKDIKKEFGKSTDGMKVALSSFNRLQSISNKFQEDALGISKMSSREIKSNITNIQKEIRVQQEALKLLKEKEQTVEGLTETEKKMVAELESENVQNNIALNTAKKRLDKEKEIQKTLGLSGAAIKGIQGALGKIGIDSSYFEDVADNMEKSAESGSKWKAAMTGLKGIAKGIGEALSDPLVIITMIYKTVKFLISAVSEFTKGVSKAGQALGIAGKNAENTYMTIRKSQDLYYFPDELIEGQKKYNEAVGFNLAYNKENAALMQDLTHYLGLSDEQAGKLVRRSRILGRDFNSMDKDMVGVTNSFNKQNKTAVPYAKVLDQISKVSASTAFNIKGGTKGLAEAAAIAARYGREMDDINNSAMQLLNFEDSISNEIEAELLMGKDLNLEKLRYAALTGDVTTQAKEQERLVRENFKNLKGNRLAQDAFAKSVGMTTDEVAKMVEQQQIEADILKKEGVAGLQRHQDEIKAQAKQAKEAEATDRAFKSAVMQLKTALLPLIQKITPFFITMAESMTSIAKVLTGGVGKTILAIIAGAGALYAGGKIVKGIGGLFGGGMGMGDGMVGGDKPGTAKQGFLGKVLGFGGKIGTSATNPMYVFVVNQGKGAGGIMDILGGGGSKTSGWAKGLKLVANILPAAMAIGGSLLQNKAQSKAEEAQKAAASGDTNKAKQLQKSAQNYQTAGESMSQTGEKGLASQFLSGAKNLLVKGSKYAGSALQKLNPTKATGTFIRGNAAKFFGKLFKFPVIGTLLEGVFANSDIKNMIADKNITKDQLSQSVGKRTMEGLGGVLGSIGGAALGSLIPVPGVATFLGGLAGDFVGRWLGGIIADNVGAKPIGDIVLNLYKDQLKDAGRPMAKGGIVTGPTRALVGEAGPEAVIPLSQLMNEFKEMKQILTAILHKEGTITLNGTRMGTAMAVGSYKVQ